MKKILKILVIVIFVTSLLGCQDKYHETYTLRYYYIEGCANCESNYLPWQLAYTEFYFTDVHWPDFNKEELIRAFEKYNKRERRFGGVTEE